MAVESLARALGEHAFVAELSRAQVEFLTGCAKNARYERGQFLFREDTPADTLFLLRQGKVALEADVPGRGSVQVETLGPGGVLGWSVLFPPYLWHLDGRAVEPTLAFAIDGHCLRNKIEQDKEFGYAVVRRLLFEVHRRLDRARLQQLDVYKAEVS